MMNSENFNRIDLNIPSLGGCKVSSPLEKLARETGQPVYFVDDGKKLLFNIETSEGTKNSKDDHAPPALELAGPRQNIYFDPSKTNCAIVTCGGLCPGINNVIRAIVYTLFYRYGVKRILGVPYGYQGLVPQYGYPMIDLTPDFVRNIHDWGGTVLSSSRGHQDSVKIVNHLKEIGISILFVIGGDGTLRGALRISEEIHKRGLKISVIGIPKTVDNDILYIDRSFGFETAFSEAVKAITSAHTESRGAPNGIGLVKLMGRHSGYITCYSALAKCDVNFVLIPEVPFELQGEKGLLEALKKRLKARQHAVILVAEGAGQEYLKDYTGQTDASGNIKLSDIGLFLKNEIETYFKKVDMDINVKYIDPSYIVRSVPASADDSVLCARLAQNAVHAGMSGKTGMVVATRHGKFVHIPMVLTASGRRQVDPNGSLWLSVLEATGQPFQFK